MRGESIFIQQGGRRWWQPRELRLSWALTQRAFQRQLTYRTATIAGLITNFFFGLLRVAVMVALYGARTEVAGVDLTAAITYTGLA
ncbi:MAG: hypothetical protein KDE31_34410, partial [Caldilineaceae bacterium]|nr:hypothetical protein [Caldilineaceae bacterium]